MFTGKSTINGPLLIAVLIYQRVYIYIYSIQDIELIDDSWCSIPSAIAKKNTNPQKLPVAIQSVNLVIDGIYANIPWTDALVDITWLVQ